MSTIQLTRLRFRHLAEAVCAGADKILDAVVIPETLDELLVERLAELPDEQWVNRRLFTFLNERASDRAFKLFISVHPTILSRKAVLSWRLSYDPKVLVHARAHRLGLLRTELRSETGMRLQAALLDGADASFLDDDDILALLQPTRLLHLALHIRAELLGEIPSIAAAIADGADLDGEPADNFDDLRLTLRSFSELFKHDASAKRLLVRADEAISTEIEKLERKKKENEAENDEEDDDWDWENYSPGRAARTSPGGSTPRPPRSIFSDVDQ